MWLKIYYLFCYLVFGYTLSLMISYVVLVFLSYRAQKKMSATMPDDESLKYLMQGSPLLPKVSIIAPAFNEEVTIIDNVNSLMQIDYPNYDIIIVNDASTDHTLEFAHQQLQLG